MRFTQFLMNGIPAHGPHMYFNADLVPKNFYPVTVVWFSL